MKDTVQERSYLKITHILEVQSEILIEQGLLSIYKVQPIPGSINTTI